MAFPIVPLIDLANAVVSFFASVTLYRLYRNNPSVPVLLFFSQAYAVLIISYLFFSLPRIFFSDNNELIGYGFVVAQAFLYIGMALFSRVSMYFVNVRRMRLLFWMVMSLVMVAIVLNIAFYNEPVYDQSTSLTEWNIDPIVSYASLVILGGVLLVNIVFFFRQAIRTKYSLVRTRSAIIGVGLLFLLVTAYTYYEATTPLGVLVSDLFSLTSLLIVFFGIIYGREHAPLSARLRHDTKVL